MDKKNVQKSIWRNLFVKKRAALGNLRNFFRGNKSRPLCCTKMRSPQLLNLSLERNWGICAPPLKYIICKNNISCKYIKCQSISLVKPN